MNDIRRTRIICGNDQCIIWIACVSEITCIFIGVIGEARTILERIRANARDTIGDRDARETCASKERTAANGHDTIRDRYIVQTLATLEHITLDVRDTVWDFDASKAYALRKRRGVNYLGVGMNAARGNLVID